MLVALAGILVGIWLIIQSQGPANATTLTLVLGIAVAVLCAAELLVGARPWRRAP